MKKYLTLIPWIVAIIFTVTYIAVLTSHTTHKNIKLEKIQENKLS
jgi:hypothetical protein